MLLCVSVAISKKYSKDHNQKVKKYAQTGRYMWFD